MRRYSESDAVDILRAHSGAAGRVLDVLADLNDDDHAPVTAAILAAARAIVTGSSADPAGADPVGYIMAAVARDAARPSTVRPMTPDERVMIARENVRNAARERGHRLGRWQTLPGGLMSDRATPATVYCVARCRSCPELSAVLADDDMLERAGYAHVELCRPATCAQCGGHCRGSCQDVTV